MKRQSVNSSNIAAIGYDEKNKVLEIEFNTGSIYHYLNLPKKLADDLLKASSIGRFFNKEIRNERPFVKGEYKTVVEFPNVYICGKAGAGKTHAAQYLMKKLGYVQAKFAFPVYGIAYDYFNMDKKDRLLLQTIGTECARDAVNENIWVNRFVEDTKIVQLTRKKLGLPTVGLVCDDVRFLNEKSKLAENGWVGLYLDVPDEIRIQRLTKRDGDAQTGTLQHSSETAIDSFKDDLIQIYASGTLKETYKQLDVIMEDIKE